MEDKVLKRIEEISERLEGHLKQREDLIRRLRHLDVAIETDKCLIVELKDLLNEDN